MKRHLVMKNRLNSWLILPVAVGGIICGLIAAKTLNLDMCRDLGQELADYYPTVVGQELSKNILKTNLLEIVKIYLLGLCLIGPVLILGYLFCQSFNLGFVVLFMLTQNPWQDWQIVWGAVIVPQILFFPLIIAASGCMLKMSSALFLTCKQELLKEWLRKSVVMLGILFLSILVSLIIGGILAKIF